MIQRTKRKNEDEEDIAFEEELLAEESNDLATLEKELAQEKQQYAVAYNSSSVGENNEDSGATTERVEPDMMDNANWNENNENM